MAPLFLDSGSGKSVELGKENKAIRVMVKNSLIGTFIIAVNRSKTESYSVSFKVDKSSQKNVSVFGEDRTIIIDGPVLTDQFKPLDVHIYRLEE